MIPKIIMLLFVLSIAACTKNDALLTGASTPPTINNIPPEAYAGSDRVVFLPGDSCVLVGKHSGGSLQSVLWQKISGPGTVTIENPMLLTTKVRNLQKGSYKFVLTVTNASKLFAKDTITIAVEAAAGNNNIMATSLTWIFPWYASVEVKNILSLVPPGTPMKVFIQRSFETWWIEVPPVSSNSSNSVYEYFVETRPDGAGMYNHGSLYVFYYGNNTNDTPSVKVIFD